MILAAATVLLKIEDPDLAPPSDGYKGPYHLVSKPEREIELTVDYKISKSSGEVTGWVVVVPSPPKIPAQPDVKMTVKFAKGRSEMTKFRETSRFNREITAYTVNLAEPTIQFSIKYYATMWSRRLVAGAATTPPTPLSRAERLMYTGPTPTCDYTSEPVASWIRKNKLKRNADESELAFAYRAFEAVRSNFTYLAPLAERDFWKCSNSLARGSADCGGSNLLFAAVLRANKIPARVFCGWHALVGKPGIVESHSRSEFYIDAIGWVPVDSTAPEKLGDATNNTFLFGLDPGWYFTDEIETDFSYRIPGGLDINDVWEHQMTAPYFADGRPNWEGLTFEVTKSCRNLRIIGDGWYARNSVRN